MDDRVDAIYENGAFRPVGNPRIAYPEGTRVLLSVSEIEPTTSLSVLDVAASVYSDLSKEEIEEIEKVAYDRKDFFNRLRFD